MSRTDNIVWLPHISVVVGGNYRNWRGQPLYWERLSATFQERLAQDRVGPAEANQEWVCTEYSTYSAVLGRQSVMHSYLVGHLGCEYIRLGRTLFAWDGTRELCLYIALRDGFPISLLHCRQVY